MSSVTKAVKGDSADGGMVYGKRKRLSLLMIGLFMAHTAAGNDNVVIASFENPDSVKDWFSVNDGVMGGVSKGGFERTEGNTLLFSGDLSLENIGGFASIRTKPADLDLTGARGVSVVIAGRVSLAGALEAGQGVTLQGSPIAVTFTDGRVRIGSATLLKADIPASNGTIHVIDQVLLPTVATIQPLTPTALIERAIALGVPLFNRGNEGACAAVYEIACESLLGMPGVPEDSRKDLAEALATIRTGKTDHDKAWLLRRALDRTISRGFK
jgi:hypothetical protein